MLLQCAHCGAPLDVKEGVSVVRCSYCAFKTERSALVTLAHETPKTFAPPKVWRPPEDAPHPSDVELTYRPQSSAPLWIFLFLILIGPAIALVASLHECGTFSETLDSIASKPLDGSPAELGKRLGGGRVLEKALYVKVRHPQIDEIYFLWDLPELSHPYFVGLILRQGESLPSGTCERLSATLGELPSKSWSLGGAQAYCDPKGNMNVAVTVPKPNGPSNGGRWKRALDTLFHLLTDAALDKPTRVTVPELRSHLATGYSMSDLANLDVSVDIDNAESMLKQKLGGAVATSDGYRYELMVSHHPLGRVYLSWDNRTGGKLSSAGFSTPVWQPLGESQHRLASCIAKHLGDPRVTETDHVKKSRSYQYEKSSVYLGDTNLSISQPTQDKWVAVVAALAECGQ